MSSIKLLQCKKLIAKRCLQAIVLSYCLQLLALFIFLIYMNFNILQPLHSLKRTISFLFSFSIWVTLVMLMIAQFLNGVYTGKLLITVNDYCGTRFIRFCKTVLQKSILFVLYVATGFLTSILYASFLHDYFSSSMDKQANRSWFSSFYLFLIGGGISAGMYHFFTYTWKQAFDIEFPIIQQKFISKLRFLLYTTISQSITKSIKPVLYYAIVYWLFKGCFLYRLASWFSVELDATSMSLFNIMSNLRILFYTWILTAVILSNCHLMQQLLSIFLCQDINFEIEHHNPLMAEECVITLPDALAMDKLPIIQMLASFNLYTISTAIASEARKRIFSLSVPGGHAYNWNQLSSQCLVTLKVFTDDLNEATKCLNPLVPLRQLATSNPAETAEKMLLRQYNNTHGIRRMVKDPDSTQPSCTNQRTVINLNAIFENMYKRLLNSLYRKIPALQYMFGEIEGAKLEYLLAKSDIIAWLVQGLASLYAVSLAEDQYGVVQVNIAETIKATLKLKCELDKLHKVPFNDQIVQKNIDNLMNAVKRSIYKMTSVFGQYLEDIIDDPHDLRLLTCFANYRIA